MSNHRATSALPIVLALVSLLLSACQPTATPTEPAVTLTATPVVSPSATSTAVTVESATPATPTAVVPTEPSPRPTVEPATPISTPTSETSPLPTAAPERAEIGNADVTYVRAVQAANNSWTFHVTVQHPDTGWEDYADGWDVLTLDGTVIKPDPDSPFTRLLTHPHENEQPFTRSQSGIVMPNDVTQVRVRAHDLVDGYGGREVIVDLTVSSGPDFEVERRP
jgi:hypothetical protein